MSKNVKINGVEYNGVSTVELITTDGESAMFKDIDEIASFNNVVALASGEFGVDEETNGKDAQGNYQKIVEHGMDVKPDVVMIRPKYWFDTQDNNLKLTAYNTTIPVAIFFGTRTVSTATNWYGVDTTEDLVTDTTIKMMAGVYAKFKPTYIDADGNEGTQIYQWIAVKFAE